MDGRLLRAARRFSRNGRTNSALSRIGIRRAVAPNYIAWAQGLIAVGKRQLPKCMTALVKLEAASGAGFTNLVVDVFGADRPIAKDANGASASPSAYDALVLRGS